jgi:isocitrate dehydrogenase (NAD+)
VETAIASVIKEGRSVTYDMKPTPDDPTAATTSGVADAIISKLGNSNKGTKVQRLGVN